MCTSCKYCVSRKSIRRLVNEKFLETETAVLIKIQWLMTCVTHECNGTKMYKYREVTAVTESHSSRHRSLKIRKGKQVKK